MSEKEELWAWLQIGIDKGWATQPFCHTHDGDPFMTQEEQEDWEEGGDPCCFVTKMIGLN